MFDFVCLGLFRFLGFLVKEPRYPDIDRKDSRHPVRHNPKLWGPVGRYVKF